MMQLQILPGKSKTIAGILHKTFPVLKCFDNEKLALISPRLSPTSMLSSSTL
jgi:hypothetical protein